MPAAMMDIDECAIIRAIEDNLFEAWEMMMRYVPHAEFRRTDEMLIFSSGISFPLLNGVFRARLRPENMHDRIEEVLDYFREKDLPMIWWTGPQTEPSDLGEALVSRALIRSSPLPGMAIRLDSLPEQVPLTDDPIIERVSDKETLRRWEQAFMVGFDVPAYAVRPIIDSIATLGFAEDNPFSSYLASSEGRPVSTLALYYGAGVVGIYCVATVPEARKKGIATALLLHSLHQARQQGCRIAILHASEMGYSLYRRMGFVEYCQLGQYLFPRAQSVGEVV